MALRPSGLRTSSQKNTRYALQMAIFAIIVQLFAFWLLNNQFFLSYILRVIALLLFAGQILSKQVRKTFIQVSMCLAQIN